MTDRRVVRGVECGWKVTGWAGLFSTLHIAWKVWVHGECNVTMHNATLHSTDETTVEELSGEELSKAIEFVRTTAKQDLPHEVSEEFREDRIKGNVDTLCFSTPTIRSLSHYFDVVKVAADCSFRGV